MGYTYSGDAVLGVSLNVNTPKPLDIRAVVNSTADLYSIPESTAYKGMTVANIADGNIYMLVDKTNINNKSGWRASYESIQIIACTAEEYKTWLDNTEINGEIFTPKEESLPFIHSNTYYYVYEDSGITDEEGNIIKDSQNYYVTRSFIEKELKGKASAADVETLSKNLENVTNNLITLNETLTNSYSTSEVIANLYYNKDYIDSTYYLKSDIYTKIEIDDKFVTKESLRGDSLEGEDDFVFVTQNQYNEDKTTLNETLTNYIQTDSEAKLSSLEVPEIKSDSLKITAKEILLGDDPILTESKVPKHIALTQDEYEILETKDEDTYYYIYQDQQDGWVTRSTLNALLSQEISKLQEKINQLENQLKELTDKVNELETPTTE